MITLNPGEVTLATLRRIYETPGEIVLPAAHMAQVETSHAAIASILADGHPVYGINTGFGLLAQTQIADDELEDLQRNLVMSHCTGVGAPLSDAVVRLILALKVVSLARGYSGVSPATVTALITLYNHEVYPLIPSKGSVGASGDLAPLAHMSATLLGIGSVRHKGFELPASEGLKLAGLTPMTLAPKEGLALINGTQVSTALALAGLFATENLFAAAVVAGAMSVDALKGSDLPFDPRIQAVRGHRGQIDVAASYRRLLTGSRIRASHVDCPRVQDPYSLRCQPQVMGACLDSIRHAARVLEIEANAVTDNPLLFTDTNEAISGGNFHAEPVAFVADFLALSIAEIANISERRLSILVDPKMSGLPAFLVEKSGVNSGFMIAQVTAAALASENKTLAHPASVDTIPTSANQEDHVSMATFAARRLGDMCENSATVIGIELIAAAQGIDFHRPLTSSPILETIHGEIRAEVTHYDRDRYFKPDIDAARLLVESGLYLKYMDGLLPSIESKP
ncbi:histidine ammonia-lyase [Govanella unica]|uniref:Histidine ammonia-lyase n=1 Tax=Govanella unica TaxID=2975056 RepID=A0A9X3Z5U8_9PROT|nr:histidine ammonia-lyase [Govania unica]MDA5192422.1 histidine ammonia-lyase [Govania unica]